METTRRDALAGAAAAAAFGLDAAEAKGRDVSTADPLALIDAVETAKRIRVGEITAAEATRAAVARARRRNPEINAVVNDRYDAAQAEADDKPQGLFGGVPTFRKDLNDRAGVSTEFGSRAFKGNPGKDNPNPFFKRFEAMGFVELGKSSTPEFGLTATTEPLSHGPTRNPWNLGHSSGGSSGGAAALVAAGVVPVAHASDGGGSIRIPASCCGLFGLKVSASRFPAAYDETGIPIVLSVHGLIARSVRDVAGFAAGMEQKNDLPAIGLVEGAGQRRVKIGLFTKSAQGTPVDKAVIEATRRAGRLCQSLGHAVEEIEPPFDASPAEDFLLYWASGAAKSVVEWETATNQVGGYAAFEPLTLGLVAHYETNRARMQGAVRRLSQFPSVYESTFGSYDIFLSPVVAAPPPPIGYLNPALAYEVAIERLLTYAAFTGVANLAGAPAISVPLNWVDGLPVGAHFLARRGRERTLLELAFELEAAEPWTKRRPPVFG